MSVEHLDVLCRTKDNCQSSLRVPCLLPASRGWGTWRGPGSVGLGVSYVRLCQTGGTESLNLSSGIFGHLYLLLNEAHDTCGVTQQLWLSVRSVDVPGLIFNLFLECDLEMSFTLTLKRLV